MADEANILVVDRPKAWLHDVGNWGRLNGIDLIHYDELDGGRRALRGDKHACGIVNVSFAGLDVLDEAEQSRSPWIVVSDEPWLEAASRAVESGATAYLHEPVHPEVLIGKIRAALRTKKMERTASAESVANGGTRQQFQDLIKELEQIPKARADVCVGAFVDLTMRNMVQAAYDLRQICFNILGQRSEQSACHFFDCPRLQTLTEAIRESIRVLERTKNAFKSQDLADLRKRLEALLKAEAQEHE